MGGVVDAVGGLFGVDGGGSVDPLKYRPYGVTSALGQTSVASHSLVASSARLICRLRKALRVLNSKLIRIKLISLAAW